MSVDYIIRFGNPLFITEHGSPWQIAVDLKRNSKKLRRVKRIPIYRVANAYRIFAHGNMRTRICPLI